MSAAKRKEHLFSFLFYAIISAKKKTIKKEEDAMDFMKPFSAAAW